MNRKTVDLHTRRALVFLFITALFTLLLTSCFDAPPAMPHASDTDGATADSLLKGDETLMLQQVENPAIITGEGSVAAVAAKATPSVVEIRTETVSTSPFYGNYINSGAGSGVIVSENGYIVTNYHVIDGASKLTVILKDGTEYEGVVVGKDFQADIALVHIAATGLPAATFSNSDALVVGQEVVAIGNPLGELGGTVTNGIVSALARNISIEGVSMSLLQTNAAINPGNSGGGLFDMNGNLIAVVNAKYSSSGIEGLGFAIPSNQVIQILREFIANGGYVSGRPYLGLHFSSGLTISSYEFASELAVGETIEEGDYLYAVDGIEVEDLEDVSAYLTRLHVGDTVQLTVLRTTQQSGGSWWGGTSYTRRYYTVTVTVHENVPGKTDIDFELQ